MKNKFLLKASALLIVFLLLINSNILAETYSGTANPNYLSGMLGDTLVGLCAIIGLGAIVYLFNLAFLLLRVEKLRLYKEKGIPIPEPKPKKSFWKSLYQRATQAVPVSQEADVMLDHDYDGIRELDNSLPPWWVAMFYITIVIGTVYFAYYHYYDIGLSSAEEYALEMEYGERLKARFLEKQANLIDESNVQALTDEASLAQGHSIFIDKCATCHGKLGEGGVGPNMTDDYWIHGGDVSSIFSTIKYGVPEKGMIAWKAQLRPADIHKVSSYLLTLVGTNPPNPKEPQGEKFVNEVKEN